MATQVNKSIYRIIYFNNEDMFEIYATQIYQSDIYGFIEVEELLFGNRSSVVVDPSEEKLKSEFDGVKRSFIPVAMVVRIDEVEKSGVPKIKGVKGSSVTALSPAPRN